MHAEPDAEQPTIGDGDCWWLALWEGGTVTRHSSALALLREVRARDRRASDRRTRLGTAAIFATLITWHDTPPGFVPPTLDDLR